MFNEEGNFSFEEYARMEGIKLSGSESEKEVIQVVTTLAMMTFTYYDGLINAGMPEALAMELTLKHSTNLQDMLVQAEEEAHDEN